MALRLILALLLASALLAQTGAPGLSPEKEAAIGASMAAHFRDTHQIVTMPEGQAYLDRIVRELAAAQSGDGPCCTVELYAWDLAGAKVIAYPGGRLFVPTKLFFTSADERELVELVAHAVAHARLRDWSRPSPNYATIPVTVILPSDDQIVPLGMRPDFEAREQRADQAAALSAQAVEIGTGEFERIRDLAPRPGPRPSLVR